MRAAALIAQPGYGADADRHDVFAELADRDFLRCVWRVGPAKGALFGELPGPALETEPSRDANQVMYLPFAVRRIAAAGSTGWNYACINLVRSYMKTLLLASTALAVASAANLSLAMANRFGPFDTG
jgi:hypothetical protein